MLVMATEAHALIEGEIDSYISGNRTKAAALLAWFLERVWGLDPSDVEASICDGPNDKGVDGLVVNRDLQEIVIFQSQYCERENGVAGDAKLKQFTGTASAYFQTRAGIEALLRSAPNDELRSLLTRTQIVDLFDNPAVTFATKLVYVTNCTPDRSAIDYTATDAGAEIDLWGQDRISAAVSRVRRPDLLDQEVTFTDPKYMEDDLSDQVKIYFAVIPATQLVALPGIADSSVFDQNVRLGLGNTKINKELRDTIQDAAQHPLFPAFHNGLTILTHEVAEQDGSLKLTGISVVNGCQSLLTLYRNRAALTDSLKVLVRIIQIERENDLIDIVTYRTNNQNPVNVRDQRSNSVSQRRLQDDVRDTYGTSLFYSIKRGEVGPVGVPVFDNGLAAQMLMSVWLKDPAGAVRKNVLFEDDTFYRIFSHDIDAHKIYLASILNGIIEQKRTDLPLLLQSSFASVRFAIAFLAAEMMRSGGRGEDLFSNPGAWLPEREPDVRSSVEQFVSLAIDIVDNYVTEKTSDDPTYAETHDPNFDSKIAFKSSAGVADINRAAQITNRSEARRATRSRQPYYFEAQPVR